MAIDWLRGIGLGLLVLLGSPASISLASSPPPAATCAAGPERHDATLEAWVKSEPLLRTLAENAATSRLQIRIYLPPSFDAPCGQLMEFRPDAEYLYPASAIKIVPAIAVLSAWSLGGPGVPPLDAPLLFSERSAIDDFGNRLRVGGHAPQSLASHLEAMLVESSNGSFNALFEIVGTESQNSAFHAGGFPSVRLLHRLSGYRLPESLASYLPEVRWMRDGAPVIWREARSEAPPRAYPPRLSGESIGTGFIDANSGQSMDGPMSFADKNGITLADLQRILVALAKELPPSDQATLPALSPAAVARLLGWMRGPLAEKDGVSAESREARFKPMLPGLLALGLQRDEISYTNKAGRAYGFHLDNARIEIGGRIVYVAVGMLANQDGVFNDDRYDYDQTSFPALRAIGTLVANRLFGASPASQP